LLSAAALHARSAETVYFRAALSAVNEVPAVAQEASGTATVIAHVVRDDAGEIAGGSVDFIVNYSFPAATTVTGMHIHSAPAGVNGPVVVNSGLSQANPFRTDDSGRGTFERQAQVQTNVAVLRNLLADPSQFYVNLHTPDFPDGVIRGQLQRAEATLLMGLMSPLNEVPPIGLAASGVAAVTVISTAGSAQLIFETAYRFPSQATFTGYHIHNGPAGVNAGVVFNTGIGAGAASVTSPESGAGTLRRPVEVGAERMEMVRAMLADPSRFYINLHTTEFPGGAIRAQLRRTDNMRFQVTMLPSNEVPALALDASATAQAQVHTLRYPDGSVQAGVVLFDANYRFPGAATFTGFHIHDGAAGANGPVTINTGLSAANPVVTESGFGNIMRQVVVSEGAGLATLNSLVRSPESHYINLHTSVNPGGAVRAQLAAANAGPPVVSAVLPGNQDGTAASVAQGGIVTILGTNLAKVTTDLSGWEGEYLPDLLNGVAVAVGGQRARLLYVSPNLINAVLAFETPVGQQLAAVNNGNAPGAPVAVQVAAVAPAMFFNQDGGLIVRASDFSSVGRANPARAGEVVLIYGTGLGQTTPALETGQVPQGSPAANTAPVAVTIGGQTAEVISSTASPGLAGVYQVAARVPAGLTPGTVPVVVGGSTAVNMHVQ